MITQTNGQSVTEEIGEHYIDLEKVLASKKVKVPGFVLRLMDRLLHVKDLNRGIYKNRDKKGLDFVEAFFCGDLDITVSTKGEDHIPQEGFPMIVGNHPLGGPDGLALMSAVGRKRKDVKFPVNDFLMYLPGLRDLFIPIDKVHHDHSNIEALENAFAGENALLYFPAGICSRRIDGEVQDLDWKPTFVKKAVKYKRDVVPVFFDAQNRRRFYTLANLRKKIGVKFNFEMALLPGEMFAQKGKTFGLTFGKPIPYTVFDNRHTPLEWAALVRAYVYELKKNPDAEFSC